MLTESHRWRSQYQRIQRWYKKVQQINPSGASLSDDELDVLYAFFMNCFHLYDWLKHSDAVPKNILDEFFFENEEMKLCHDICIGAKHLKITRPKVDADYRVAREYIAPFHGDGPNTSPTRLALFKGKIVDMTTLAGQCINSVQHFLNTNKLR